MWERVPRMHRSEDLESENENLHLKSLHQCGVWGALPLRHE